jgi:hypothetical protein
LHAIADDVAVDLSRSVEHNAIGNHNAARPLRPLDAGLAMRKEISPWDPESPHARGHTIECHVPREKAKLSLAVSRSTPSRKELEIALLKRLRENRFSGAEHVSVFVVDPKRTLVDILTLSSDGPKALEDLLAPVMGKRIQEVGWRSRSVAEYPWRAR